MVDTMGSTANYDVTALWYKSSKMGDGREEGGEAEKRRTTKNYPI